MNTSEGCKWDLRFRDLWGQREPVQLRDWLPQKYKDVKIGEDMKYKSNAELQAESSYKLCMTCNVGVYQRDSTNYNEDGSHHVCVKTIYTVPPHVGVNGRANMTTDEAIADYASLWGDDKPNLELNKRDAKRCN